MEEELSGKGMELRSFGHSLLSERGGLVWWDGERRMQGVESALGGERMLLRAVGAELGWD